MHTIGSGPVGTLKAAALASISAFSLPSMFECAGTQSRSTLLVSATLFKVSQHSRVSAELNLDADRAFRADSLSEHMKIISFVIPLFIIEWQLAMIALISDRKIDECEPRGMDSLMDK